MSIKTFEVRSEEEGVGNLLLVVTDQDFASDGETLKSLWIEAQEYDDQIQLDVIESDYLKEHKDFKLKEVSAEDFKSRLDCLFSIIESYDQKLEELPEKSLAYMKEFLAGKGCAANSKILLLDDDFSTYSAFIVSGSSKAL